MTLREGTQFFAGAGVVSLISYIIGLSTLGFCLLMLAMTILTLGAIWAMRRLGAPALAVTLILIVAGATLFKPVIGWWAGGSEAAQETYGLLYGGIAVSLSRAEIAARQQMQRVDAIRAGRTARITSTTPLYQAIGGSFENLEPGTSVNIRYEIPVDIRLSASVGNQPMTYVVVQKENGTPSGRQGWVLSKHLDDRGPDPILGFDAKGRSVPQIDPAEKVYDLKPGEQTEVFINWDHGDERQGHSFQDNDPGSGRTFQLCTAGICQDLDPNKVVRLKLEVPYTLKAGPQGASIKLTRIIARNQKG